MSKVFSLNKTEKEKLRLFIGAKPKIKILKAGLYPNRAFFSFPNKQTVTLHAREEDIAYKFEVFPICIESQEAMEKINFDDGLVVQEAKTIQSVSILRKFEWCCHSTDEKKVSCLEIRQML